MNTFTLLIFSISFHTSAYEQEYSSEEFCVGIGDLPESN